MGSDDWDPFRELVNLRNRFDQLFERRLATAFVDDDSARAAWAPPVDVFEDEQRIVVQAEIPGVCEDSVSLEFREGVLVIRGERPTPRGDRVYHRIERLHGPFERLVRVASKVDVERIQASYEQGLLTVSLPLSPPDGRTIHIQESPPGHP
jgi:HSP20 family protein